MQIFYTSRRFGAYNVRKCSKAPELSAHRRKRAATARLSFRQPHPAKAENMAARHRFCRTEMAEMNPKDAAPLHRHAAGASPENGDEKQAKPHFCEI